MSDLYSVIPALSPTSDEIVAAELLARQILEAKFPDLELREGTGLRDLVLRPTAYAFALLKKATDYYFSSNTLAGVNNTTDTEIIDDILSNWFMARHTGEAAVISARLYFAAKKTVTVSASTYFSTDGSLKFFPSSTQTFTAQSFSLDSYSNEWYVDIELTAESSGTSYNIGEGSLLYFGNFDPYFLHGEINYLSQTASNAETNVEFITRSQAAISTRNLINIPSITSNLQTEFNNLPRIQTVGMGDSDMIRDQIKVVIDPESPRYLSALTSSGTVATATLVNHGFQVGQIFNVTGALPTGYNGQFSVTSLIGVNQFTFNLLSTAASVTALPYVQSYTAPCLVHTGGKVDLYVGDTYSTSITQLTTDSNGLTQITGPIFKATRSSISGGGSDDTIPFSANINLSASSYDPGHTVLQVTTLTAHGLPNGTPVSVSGLVQSHSVTSLSCVNLVVTAAATSHGLSTGMSVTISGATPTSYNGTYVVTVVNANTFTYVVSGNILTSATGTLVMTNPSVNGSFVISSVGATTFNVAMPAIWSGATNDFSTVAISYSPIYAISNPYQSSSVLQTLTGVGNTATATLNNHGLSAGRFVTITGATPSYYNGTFKITQVLGSTQFQFNIPSTILTPATGTVQCTYTTPWNDVGFSENQVLNVNFGSGFANSTVSFEVSYFNKILDVQNYLNTPAQHILCGDYLARGFNTYVLDLNVVVYNSSAPTTGLIHSTSEKYLSSLAPGSTFMLSDLVAALNTAGITNIQTPMGVTYTYYHRDLVTPMTGTITDYLDPLDATNVFVLGSVTTSGLAV